MLDWNEIVWGVNIQIILNIASQFQPLFSLIFAHQNVTYRIILAVNSHDDR